MSNPEPAMEKTSVRQGTSSMRQVVIHRAKVRKQMVRHYLVKEVLAAISVMNNRIKKANLFMLLDKALLDRSLRNSRALKIAEMYDQLDAQLNRQYPIQVLLTMALIMHNIDLRGT